jgi:DNA-directed RNA polymerase specialized sigma24 family protein
LNCISTHWSTLSNPSRFVTRYGAAVRAYLRALLPTQDDADEVEQEFLLQVVAKGFPTAAPQRGRFRHYLIAIVRNAAYAYLRKRSRQPAVVGDLSHIPTEASADREWQRSWRECVLRNTWNVLRDPQKRNKGTLCHSVLKASVEHPEEDSTALAARVSQSTGQALSAEALRKQLSRARQRFGELLVDEVSRTISDVTPELLAEELRDLDLMKYVRTLLPEGFPRL